MKGIDLKEINHQAFRGVVWVGKAALFCFGLLAVLALVLVMAVLTAVMLAATIFPATAGMQKRDLEQRHRQKGSQGHRHQLQSGDKPLTQ